MSTYDADPWPNLTTTRADALRFGDRLPYFAANVRSVKDRGNGTVRVNFVHRIGQDRTHIVCYATDVLHVVRAGSARGVA